MRYHLVIKRPVPYQEVGFLCSDGSGSEVFPSLSPPCVDVSNFGFPLSAAQTSEDPLCWKYMA